MWFAHKVDPTSAEFTVVWSARLIGTVDPERLAAAWRNVLSRHDELRLRLTESTAGLSRGYWSVDSMSMSIRAVAPEALSLELESAVGRVFMLEKEPLADLTLLRLGPEDHVLVVSAHHAVMDGRSLDIVIDDLFTGYDGWNDSSAGPSYRDYIEEETAESPDPSRVDRWVDELGLEEEDDSTPLGLPSQSLSQDRSACSVRAGLSLSRGSRSANSREAIAPLRIRWAWRHSR